MHDLDLELKLVTNSFAAFELKLIAYKIASMAIIVLFAGGWLVLLGPTIATWLLALDVSMTLSNFSFLGHIQHYCGYACTGLASPAVSRRRSD